MLLGHVVNVTLTVPSNSKKLYAIFFYIFLYFFKCMWVIWSDTNKSWSVYNKSHNYPRKSLTSCELKSILSSSSSVKASSVESSDSTSPASRDRGTLCGPRAEEEGPWTATSTARFESPRPGMAAAETMAGLRRFPGRCSSGVSKVKLVDPLQFHVLT